VPCPRPASNSDTGRFCLPGAALAYITTSELEDYVAGYLHGDTADVLLSQVTAHSTQFVSNGYQEILGRLLNRGFTTAQIDAWDRRVEFSLDISTWFALRHIAQAEDSDLWPQKFDRREELDTVVVVSDGEVQEPEAGARRIGQGDLSTTYDTFVYDEIDW
jgi:hypothetical protein